MAMDFTELVDLIEQYILLGGRRTTGVNLQTVLTEIARTAASGGATGGGVKVTDPTTIALLTNGVNWNGPDWNSMAIVGHNAGDWYKDSTYFYFFDTATAPVRMYRKLDILTVGP